MSTKSDEVEFWETRYVAGNMPWDFRGVSRALIAWLKTANAGERALIPGCGSGHEVKAFHDAGPLTGFAGRERWQVWQKPKIEN